MLRTMYNDVQRSKLEQYMFLGEELIQNGTLLTIRLSIVATIFIHLLRHWQDIAAYARFNNISIRFARIALVARGILGTIIAIGIVVEWAALGLIVIFAISILLHTVRWKSPFSADSGGWEYSLLLLLLCLVVFAFGAGSFVAATI